MLKEHKLVPRVLNVAKIEKSVLKTYQRVFGKMLSRADSSPCAKRISFSETLRRAAVIFEAEFILDESFGLEIFWCFVVLLVHMNCPALLVS
jgi:hypothetical protein